MALYSNRRKHIEPSPRRMAPKYQEDLDVVRLNRVHALDEEELEKLFIWVDEIPLSRPKRNMSRDFSDGVLTAEILKYKLKSGVDLHNYPTCNNIQGKQDNWVMLNRKVLVRLKTEISHDVINAICECKPHVIESVLCILRDKIDLYLASQRQRPAGRREPQNPYDMRPEADQDNRVDFLKVHSESLDYFDSESRGYIPSAEGFYQDGQFQQPQTRRFINPEYNVGLESFPYYSPPGKVQQPPQPQGNLSGRGGGKQEMLPKVFLDEREKAIETREQSIQMLSSKVQRLEQLLRLKDMRIEDLTQKLDQLMQPTYAQPHAPQTRGGNPRLPGGNRQPVGRY